MCYIPPGKWQCCGKDFVPKSKSETGEYERKIFAFCNTAMVSCGYLTPKQPPTDSDGHSKLVHYGFCNICSKSEVDDFDWHYQSGDRVETTALRQQRAWQRLWQASNFMLRKTKEGEGYGPEGIRQFMEPFHQAVKDAGTHDDTKISHETSETGWLWW